MQFKFTFVILTMLSAFATAAKVDLVQSSDTLPPQWQDVVKKEYPDGDYDMYYDASENYLGYGYFQTDELDLSSLYGSSFTRVIMISYDYTDASGNYVGRFERGTNLDDAFYFPDDSILSNGITQYRPYEDGTFSDGTFSFDGSVTLDPVDTAWLYPAWRDDAKFEKTVSLSNYRRTYYFGDAGTVVGYDDLIWYEEAYGEQGRAFHGPDGKIIGYGDFVDGVEIWYDKDGNFLPPQPSQLVQSDDTLPPQWQDVVTQRARFNIDEFEYSDDSGTVYGYGYFQTDELDLSSLYGSSFTRVIMISYDYTDASGNYVGRFERGTNLDDAFYFPDDSILSNGITQYRPYEDGTFSDGTFSFDGSVTLDPVDTAWLYPAWRDDAKFEKTVSLSNYRRTYYFGDAGTVVGYDDLIWYEEAYGEQGRAFHGPDGKIIGYGDFRDGGDFGDGHEQFFDKDWNLLGTITRTERDYGNIVITKRVNSDGTQIDISYSMSGLVMTISNPSGSLGPNQETLEFQKKVFNHLAEGCDGNVVSQREFNETVSFETIF